MAAKDKAQKKAKLRYAEYYDFQEIQDYENTGAKSAGGCWNTVCRE